MNRFTSDDLQELTRALCDEQETEKGWSKEWPTEPGFYWLYGWRSDSERQNEKRRLIVVQVMRIRDGRLTFVADGGFMFKAEGAGGLWQRLQEPDLPTTEEID